MDTALFYYFMVTFLIICPVPYTTGYIYMSVVMNSVVLRFCGVISLAEANLLALKLSCLASVKNLCLFLTIYPSHSSNFQSVFQEQFDVCLRIVRAYVRAYVCAYINIYTFLI